VCRVFRLGSVDYGRAWELQKALVERVYEGSLPSVLLLLEHPPVYTIGRRGQRSEVLVSDEWLKEWGIELYWVDRGGGVTYHGPGQLVGYPILDLRGWGGPLKYVRTLEQVLVKTLSQFGVSPVLKEGLTGVWVGEEKIAAIGVKISRGITSHGFAINANNDTTFFRRIVPCGIVGKGVTSLARLLGGPIYMERLCELLINHFGREMGFRMEVGGVLPDELMAIVGKRDEPEEAP
jgi:lipoyl(octanoyl) transferase